jgi:hypothetical protein
MNENTKKTKACQQFLQAAHLGYNTSQFIPIENLTPFTLYNTSDTNRDILLSAFAKVNKETLFLLVLGESTKLVENLLDETHQVFEQPFVKDFAGNISLVVIDPELRLANSKTIEDAEIDSRLKEKKVVSLQLVKAKFPLTPIYGPHKQIDYPYLSAMGIPSKNALSYKQPNQFKNLETRLKPFKQRGFFFGLRRLIHENALIVLNKLVEHPSPLFISSRITSVCYRSFKYLIDVRAAFDRKTLVRYGYTDRHSVEECVSAEDYAVFPDPFQKCVSNMKNANFKKYYINDVIGRKNFNNTNKRTIRTIIKQMNQWANEELTKRIPKKQEAGFRNRTRKVKLVSKP